MELAALQGEDDQDSQRRLKDVELEVQALQPKAERISNIWQSEQNELNRVKDLKEELAQAQWDMQLARSKGDYGKAGELLHSTIPNLEDAIEQLEEEEYSAAIKKRQKKLLADSVTVDAIATIVSRHTGIPVSRITGSESRKLLHMEEQLRKQVVGQDLALEAVSNCVRLARTVLDCKKKIGPWATFSFWDHPEVERPSYVRHWLNSSLMTPMPCLVLTCPSIVKSTPSRN